LGGRQEFLCFYFKMKAYDFIKEAALDQLYRS
jgi:hypothetical protein